VTEKKSAVMPMFTGIAALLFSTNCQRRDYNSIFAEKFQVNSKIIGFLSILTVFVSLDFGKLDILPIILSLS